MRRRVLFINLSQFKVLVKNVAIVLLFLLAFFFMLINKTDNAILDKASSAGISVAGPVIHFLTLPGKGVYSVYATIKDVIDVYNENKKLRQENQFLLMQKNKYGSLRAENALLARLLNYAVPKSAKFVTVQIISADSLGFSHSVIAYVGENHEVKKGQIALNEGGVVGRVEEIGGNYVRIMLITDINSKIPVLIERTRTRGILSGDNTSAPKLIFTPLGADIKVNDMVVTSGVSGIFPAGLPIGKVSAIDNMQIKVEPLTDIQKLEYAKIVDYGLEMEPLE